MATKITMIRHRLAAWGRFWAHREAAGGWPNRSNDARLMEICRTGLFSMSSRYLVDSADEMRIPTWVNEIGAEVDALKPCERLSIRARYIMRHAHGLDAAVARSGMSMHQFRRSLLSAELSLLGRI